MARRTFGSLPELCPNQIANASGIDRSLCFPVLRLSEPIKRDATLIRHGNGDGARLPAANAHFHGRNAIPGLGENLHFEGINFRRVIVHFDIHSLPPLVIELWFLIPIRQPFGCSDRGKNQRALSEIV
jgi:hypothetical protein